MFKKLASNTVIIKVLRYWLPAVATSVLLATALNACDSGTGVTESGVSLVKSGKLTVCSDTSYEPYEFSREGKYVGFDIELSEAIAEYLNVENDILATSFEGIQSGVALDSNQCDLGVAGITITDDRRTKMDFSTSYADDNLGLLVSKSSKITSLEDISDKSLGVQVTTTGERYAKEHAKGTNVQQFETTGDMLTALKSGRVDAVLGSINVLNWTSRDDDSLTIAQEYTTGEALGVAVKKGNTKLLDAVNETLKQIKDNGEYQRMVEKWLSR